MAINKDVNINITTQNENPQSWKELNTAIKETRSELVKLQNDGKAGSAEWTKYADKLRELTKEKQIVQRQAKLTSQQLLGISRDLSVVGISVRNIIQDFKGLANPNQSVLELTTNIGSLGLQVVALVPAIQALSKAIIASIGSASTTIGLFAVTLLDLINKFQTLFDVMGRWKDGEGFFEAIGNALSNNIIGQLTQELFGLNQEVDKTTEKFAGLLNLSTLSGQAFENELKVQEYESKYKKGGEFYGKYTDEEAKALINNYKKLVELETKKTDNGKNEIKVKQPDKYKQPKVSVVGQENLNIIDEYRNKIFDLEKKLQQIEKEGGFGNSLWFKTKDELEEASIQLQAFGVNLKDVGKVSLKVGDDLDKIFALPDAIEKEIEVGKQNAESFRLQNIELVTYNELMDEILAKKEYAELLKNAIDTTVSGFQTIFGLLSDWTGDATNGVSKFFKNIQDSFNILQQVITFMQTIKSISEAIKSVEVAKGAGGSGNFFESIFGFITQFFADGGLVRGAGTGRSDSIPARLSNGEFVVNARSTKEYYPLLELINGRSRNIGNGFANGGFVNIPYRPETPIYITATMDGITFLKTNYPKYKAYKQTVRI